MLINSRSTLRKSERLDYVRAVKCLGSKPAKTPAAIASGAKSRYDDFVSVCTGEAVTILRRARSLRTSCRRSIYMATVTFCHGTATTPGHTSKLYETNVATKGISPITTGLYGRGTHWNHRCSIIAILACLEMVLSFRTGQPTVTPTLTVVLSRSSREQVEVACLDPSKGKILLARECPTPPSPFSFTDGLAAGK